jgi:signal peptidase I
VVSSDLRPDEESAAHGAFLDTAGSRSSSVAGARRQQKLGRIRSLREWATVIAGAIGIALIVRAFLLASFFIPSPSMTPTLHNGDRVLVNKLAYRLHDVHRGDVVVFERPPKLKDHPEVKDLIKRVIGLPGETVEFRDGRILIDGHLLDEPYLAAGITTESKTETGDSITVAEGEVLVLGDNRTNSTDGRIFGPISQKLIVGRAFVLYFPMKNLGFL